MKSYKKKHLRMKIYRKHIIRIGVVKFEQQLKVLCAKETE